MTLFGMPVIVVEPEENGRVPEPIVLADWRGFMETIPDNDEDQEYEI